MLGTHDKPKTHVWSLVLQMWQKTIWRNCKFFHGTQQILQKRKRKKKGFQSRNFFNVFFRIDNFQIKKEWLMRNHATKWGWTVLLAKVLELSVHTGSWPLHGLILCVKRNSLKIIMAVWKISREINFVELRWRGFAINPNQPSMSHLMLLLLLLLFFCFDKLTIGRSIKKKKHWCYRSAQEMVTKRFSQCVTRNLISCPPALQPRHASHTPLQPKTFK